MADIAAIGTALPRREYAQPEIERLCAAAFEDALAPAKRASIFAHAGVARRRLVEEASYYFSAPPFSRRNADFLKHASALAEAAIGAALEGAGARHGDVDHVFSVTTTGLLTPSLEAHLAQRLPFKRRLKRTPLFGVGCAGGAVALARAFEYLRAYPEQTALVSATELCSLSFLPRDGSATQLVAAALFADGAAAAVLRGEQAAGKPARARIVAAESVLIEDSLDVMGWDFGEDGMRLVLSPRAPELVETHLRAAVEPFLRRHGAAVDRVARFILHPGSARILDACERALDLPAGATEGSRRFLASHGNLSSASVLFILKEALEVLRPGELAFLAALGPGFACEMLLLEGR